VKVFNLTDVSTPVLETRGLVNKGIVVGREIAEPGGYKEVIDSPRERKKLHFFLQIGAVSIDKPTPPYLAAKAKLFEESQGRTPRVRPPPEPAPPPPPVAEPLPITPPEDIPVLENAATLIPPTAKVVVAEPVVEESKPKASKKKASRKKRSRKGS
jgi:hypothetical protein